MLWAGVLGGKYIYLVVGCFGVGVWGVFGWGVYLKLLAFDVRWSGALGGK